MKKTYLKIIPPATLLATLLTFIVSIIFMIMLNQNYRPLASISLTATIFTFITSIITLITFILEFISIKKQRGEFAIVALSYLAFIVIISCALTPILTYHSKVYIGFNVTAAILHFLVGTAYLINIILKTFKRSENSNLTQNSIKQLKLLNKLYKSNILSEEEYTEKKDILLSNFDLDLQSKENVSAYTKRKIIIKTIILYAVFAVYCFVAFPLINFTYKSQIYNHIIQTISHYNRENLDFYFDYLPNNYKDTNNLKTTFNKITPYALYGRRSLDFYVDLVNIQEDDQRWNFENIFEDITSFNIHDVKWTGNKDIYISSPPNVSGVSGYYDSYIYFNSSSGNTTFSTNLPNNKESSKSYYYYENYGNNCIIVGYENQSDYTDNFDAFRISNLKFNSKTKTFSINVYCYSNLKTYTMEYQYI